MKSIRKISRNSIIAGLACVALLSAIGVAGAQGLLPLPQSIEAPTIEAADRMTGFQEKNAQVALDRASGTFPYEVRLPKDLPAGTKLANAIAHTETYEGGDTVHSVDVWYRLPSGEGLHIWQTNSSKLAEAGKDPVRDSVDGSVSIGDTLWKGADTDSPGIKSFSTRFTDGVTVSVDFPTSSIDARALLATVRPM
ncbi:hypothetical protein BH23ACT12_BH23ACT12_21030 [soil metagenome]